MRKTKYKVLGIVIVFFFIVLPFLTLFGPQRLKEFCFKELCYRIIADRVTKGLSLPEQKAEALLRWVHENIFVVSAPVIDCDSLNDMLRGIAWCDQQANVLITLARKVDIPGQLLFLRRYDGVSHSVSALFIKGKYRIFDPICGYLFKNRKTQELATFQQLQDDFSEYISPQYERLKVPDYQRFYEKEYPPTVFFKSNRLKGRTRKVLSFMMDCYYRIFGRVFSTSFVSAYLSMLSAEVISDRGIKDLGFYRARANHLLGDYAKAHAIYENLIKNWEKKNIEKSELDDICFFKGVSLFDLGRHNDCIKYFRSYLEQNKETKWRLKIAYYIGRSFEELNIKDKAIRYYKQCEQQGDGDTPAPARLFYLQGPKADIL